MQFGRALFARLLRRVEGSAASDHDVAVAISGRAERAERAAVHAHVGRVEVLVDVVVGDVAVLLLADEVRQLAEREEIRVVFEKESVVEAQRVPAKTLSRISANRRLQSRSWRSVPVEQAPFGALLFLSGSPELTAIGVG